jgi:hypothetical protein
MGSKIPKVAMARAAKAKAAKAKTIKPDSSKPIACAPPAPPTPTVIPPTPTDGSFEDELLPADIDSQALLAGWNGQGPCPVSPKKRIASEKRSRATVGPQILAHLDKLSTLKEKRVYDVEEEDEMIEELGRLMAEKMAEREGSKADEKMRERIAGLMVDFRGRR